MKQGIAAEDELIEIDRFGRDHAGEVVEVFRRWEGFVERTRGTEYEAFGRARLEDARTARDEAARAALQELREDVDRLAGRREWPAALERIDSARRFFDGAPAAGKMREMYASVEADSLRTPRFFARCDFDDGPEKLRLDPGVELAGSAIEYAGNHVTLFQNWASRLLVRFDVPALPATCRLQLVHLTARQDGLAHHGYSPIWIRINGTLVAGDYVSATDGMVSRWVVTPCLVVGRNELAIQLGDAFTHHWIYYIEIVDPG